MGEAWDRPFAIVFEPHQGAAASGTVRNVTSLTRGNVVVGLKVESLVGTRNLTQYVISHPNANETYTDAALGLAFTGRFGIITDTGDGGGELYLGEGSSLSYRGNSVASVNGANTQASLRLAVGQAPIVTGSAPVTVDVAAAPAFRHIARQPDGSVSLTATGSAGVPYTLWGGANLTGASWTPINHGTVNASPFVLQDGAATNHAARYYRFSTP